MSQHKKNRVKDVSAAVWAAKQAKERRQLKRSMAYRTWIWKRHPSFYPPLIGQEELWGWDSWVPNMMLLITLTKYFYQLTSQKTMLCFIPRFLSLCLKCVGKRAPQKKSLQLSELRKANSHRVLPHGIKFHCENYFPSPQKEDRDLYTEEEQTVIVKENETKIACSIFLGTWKIHYRSLHSNNEAWQVNELLLVELQERWPIIQKFLCCANASHKDDYNFIKPTIRSSGSFKKQNTQLVLH